MPRMASKAVFKSQPPRTRRPRPTTACVQCRSRRIKCDRAKPVCSECKRQGRACNTPQENASHHILLDPHVEAVTEPQKSFLPSPQNSTPEGSETEKTSLPDGISVSPFWTLATGDVETQNDISIIHRFIIPRLESESASLDDETKAAVTRCLPPPEQCKPLIQSFLLNINPLVPLGIDSYFVEDLVVSKRDLLFAGSPYVLSLVIAVLYSGAVGAPTILTFEQMRFMYRVYEMLLKYIESSHFLTTTSTLQFIQGYILINTVRGSRGDPSTAYDFIASAIRRAQSMESYISPAVENHLQIQISRQIWWYLDFLDVEGTLASGIPGMLHSRGDTSPDLAAAWELPAMANNRLPIEACPPHSSAMATAMRGRHELAKTLQTWIKSAPREEGVANFVAFINSLLDTVPEGCETEWPRLYLSMQIDRMWCIYGRQPSESASSCGDSIIRSAQAFLEKYHRLATILSKPNYQWYLPGLTQPLHALMIALMHLSTCQNLAAEVGLRTIVDKIFSLRVLRDSGKASIVARAIVRRDEGIGGENPMSCLLYNLRRRAWERAGWEIPPS